MADLPVLDAPLTQVEQRILGSLLEKQKTVPASYPLTLNALRTACNQTSSRDPIVAYDEPLLEQSCRTLKERGLLRIVWSDSGRRTLKYHQLLDEVLGLDDTERAVVTVLLLRGPNAPGELRSRTERLHPFADRDQVEACLRELAAREQPLVRELERRPGQQDRRWMHLLGDQPGAPEPEQPVDVDAVIRDGAEVRDERVLAAYTTVAGTYSTRLAEELDNLPFERWLLGRIAEEAAGYPVADAGCGPGHVTAYLASLGAEATGFDLTPAMVEQARANFPGQSFEVGDLRRLLKPRTADGWGAVLGWYSLVHLAGSELAPAVAAMARTLRPGGLLVLALHAGPGVIHRDEWWEHEVDLDFVLHDPEQVVALMLATGLTDIESYVRSPLEQRGETTRRLYVLGRLPG
jgi:hypothetical protein